MVAFVTSSCEVLIIKTNKLVAVVGILIMIIRIFKDHILHIFNIMCFLSIILCIVASASNIVAS